MLLLKCVRKMAFAMEASTCPGDEENSGALAQAKREAAMGLWSWASGSRIRVFTPAPDDGGMPSPWGFRDSYRTGGGSGQLFEQHQVQSKLSKRKSWIESWQTFDDHHQPEKLWRLHPSLVFIWPVGHWKRLDSMCWKTGYSLAGSALGGIEVATWLGWTDCGVFATQWQTFSNLEGTSSDEESDLAPRHGRCGRCLRLTSRITVSRCFLRCQTSDHLTLYHTLPLFLEWKAGLPWVWRSQKNPPQVYLNGDGYQTGWLKKYALRWNWLNGP